MIAVYVAPDPKVAGEAQVGHVPFARICSSGAVLHDIRAKSRTQRALWRDRQTITIVDNRIY